MGKSKNTREAIARRLAIEFPQEYKKRDKRGTISPNIEIRGENPLDIRLQKLLQKDNFHG